MNASLLIEAVTDRFPIGCESLPLLPRRRHRGLARESLLEVARSLKEDPAFQMNFLMDLTAVDYSAFGKKPAPAFFASSGVAVRPVAEIPDEDPGPGPAGAARFVVVYHFFSCRSNIGCGWWSRWTRPIPKSIR